jgi:hypothetical protein
LAFLFQLIIKDAHQISGQAEATMAFLVFSVVEAPGDDTFHVTDSSLRTLLFEYSQSSPFPQGLS